MSLIDRDTLAYFAVFSGKAQVIDPKQVDGLIRQKRDVLCFVCAEHPESILGKLLASKTELDKCFSSVANLLKGLIEGRLAPHNRFQNSEVKQSDFYQIANGVVISVSKIENSAASLAESRQKLLQANEEEKKKIDAEISLKKTMMKQREELFNKTFREDSEKWATEFAAFIKLTDEEKKTRMLVATNKSESAELARQALDKALRELDQTPEST